jgi:hypothetical protein
MFGVKKMSHSGLAELYIKSMPKKKKKRRNVTSANSRSSISKSQPKSKQVQPKEDSLLQLIV